MSFLSHLKRHIPARSCHLCWSRVLAHRQSTARSRGTYSSTILAKAWRDGRLASWVAWVKLLQYRRIRVHTSKQKATYKLCFYRAALSHSNSGISAGAAIHRLLMAEIALFTIFLKAEMFWWAIFKIQHLSQETPKQGPYKVHVSQRKGKCAYGIKAEYKN